MGNQHSSSRNQSQSSGPQANRNAAYPGAGHTPAAGQGGAQYPGASAGRMNPGFFLEGMRDPGMNALRATAHQPPQMQKTHTIRNDVNLKKNTLQLHPNEANPQQYHLEFTFDASTECTVSIFYATVEHQDEGGAVRFVPTKNGTAHPCEQRPKGLGQVFRTKPEYALDTSLFAPGELGYNQAQARFPLIVCLEVAAGAATSSNVSSQTTYADIVPAPIKSTSGEGGEKLTVRPLKQKIQVCPSYLAIQLDHLTCISYLLI